MIAKVRIAPYEQWCQEYKDSYTQKGLDPLRVIGREIRIHTETMKKAEFYGETKSCDGREFVVESESANEIRSILGLPLDFDVNNWICEHMLEMD